MSRKSLVRQAQERLQACLAIGTSKHRDKQIGATAGKIYSYSTYKTYLKHICYFVHWCQSQHGCRSLDECRPYVSQYMDTRRDLSPYTLKLEVAAIRKLYGEDIEIATPDRRRKDITRSRGTAVRDAHFSEARNAAIVALCRATGLRRSELAALHVWDVNLSADGDGGDVVVRRGKGGKSRIVPIMGTETEIELIRGLVDNATDRVCPRVPDNMDIHSYRREYATRVYTRYARADIPRSDRYYCRRDKRGIVYDRPAMLVTSQALGHNRINVIAEHYL